MAEGELKMLLRRDENNSCDQCMIYDVNEERWMSVMLNSDRSISSIRLVYAYDPNRSWDQMPYFKADGLVYIENVTQGDDCEYLDTDMLAMAEKCFREVVHAA